MRSERGWLMGTSSRDRICRPESGATGGVQLRSRSDPTVGPKYGEDKALAQLGRGDCEALPPLLPAGRQNLTPALGLHAGTEAVGLLAVAVTGPERALHFDRPRFDRRLR